MKQMWRRLVAAKIRMQGSLLASLDIRGGEGLIQMAGRVGSGDTQNLEAQAARRYWPLLMGKAFRRDADAPGANALLNYGYAIMRATCARAAVGAGLHPTIGIQHSNRGNAFALADDLVEPFRPIVDALVRRFVECGVDALTPAVKRRFARLIAVDLKVGDEVSPVSAAAQRLARSLARGFENGRPDLVVFEPRPGKHGARLAHWPRWRTSHEQAAACNPERVSSHVDIRHVRSAGHLQGGRAGCEPV